MKKALSLILALALCLSLCACGDTTSTDSESNSENSNTIADEIDFTKVLMNSGVTWGYINRTSSFGFIKDGTTTSTDVTWALDGDIVKVTQKNGDVETYRFVELNGVIYLVGERNTMYSDVQIRYDEIPCVSVEITLDNWQEYLELHHESVEQFDQFGESTGETREYYHLRMKDEYSRFYLCENSEVLLRYTQNGTEHDARIDDGHEYVSIGNFTDYPFEMVKIQGTLYFVDGLK